MEPGDKLPDKKLWRGDWDEYQIKTIYGLAKTYRARFGVPMETAWRQAEQEFCDQRDPNFRRAVRREKHR